MLTYFTTYLHTYPMSKTRFVDHKRRALVLRLIKSTGMAEKSIYECLALSRVPRNKLSAQGWARVMDSYQRREALKAAKAAHTEPAPASEVDP